MVGTVLFVVAISFFAIAVIGRRWKRDEVAGVLTVWTKEAFFGSFMTVLAVAALVSMPDASERSPALGPAVSLFFFIGVATAICAWQIDKFIRRWGSRTLRQALQKSVRARYLAGRNFAKTLWKAIAAQNWSEVKPDDFSTRRLEGLRGFFGLYVVLFLAMTVLAVLGITASVLMSSDATSAGIAASASLNAALIAGHAVMAALMTIATLLLFRVTNLVQIPLSIGYALRGSAEAVGWGAAVGALFGAIIPFILAFEPLAGIFGAGPNGAVVYEPSIIVKLSTIGAVGGLLVGAAMLPSLMLVRSENLLYRRALCPFVYSVIIWGASWGLAPIGGVGRQLLKMNRPLLDIDDIQCTGVVPSGLDLDRQSIMMELVHQCGDGLLLPNGVVTGIMIPLVTGIAIVLVVNDVRGTSASA